MYKIKTNLKYWLKNYNKHLNDTKIKLMCERLNVWEIRFIHKIVSFKYMP